MSTGISELMTQRMSEIKRANTANSSSIEIPSLIDNLIDNKMYRNKFKSLIKKGHLQVLLLLADIAATKGKPSCWFATVTSKKNWDKTIAYLKKLSHMDMLAENIMKRLGTSDEGAKRLVYKACWKLGNVAERLSITAQETGRTPVKLFAFLYKKQVT